MINLVPAARRTAELVIPERLVAMAEAWRDPKAWEGETAAGGVQLSGEIAGLVALNEVMVHGWWVPPSRSRDE